MQKHVVVSQYRVLAAGQMFRPGRLPLRLHYTTSSEPTGFHLHEFAELAVVLRGKARYRTDFSERLIEAGDVLCIPEGAGHAYCDEADMELMNVLFQFDRLPLYCQELSRLPGFSVLFTLQLDFYRKLRFYPQVRLCEADFRRCDGLLRWLNELQNAETPGYEPALLGGFMQLITMLVNNYSVPDGIGSVTAPQRLSDSIYYLCNHYNSPLTVRDLARRAGMSEPSYYRHFKLATGQSPIDYLLALRLRRAAELLYAEPNCRITEAALRCGFSDGNYFARMFRRRYGYPPGRLRGRDDG